MKAVVFHRPRSVSVDRVDDPRIEHERDAIVRVTATAICGSDLHIYNGLFPQLRPLTLGHEFMGIVEDVGAAVTNLKRGDRVVVPFSVACGACFFCAQKLTQHCERTNREYYGPDGGMLREKGGGIFGFTDLFGGYAGGQAEAVRVPFADVGPRKIPDAIPDEEALFLSDIFPTGWAAIDWAGVSGGETVAVFGCGPVGIMAMKAAWLRGAARVIGVDVEDYRLEAAKRVANAETVSARRDPVRAIRAMTAGRGADVCVDAVGMGAHRSILKKLSSVVHAQVGSSDALESCFRAVRRGGAVSVVGVYGLPYDHFPLYRVFDKGIRLRFGAPTIHSYLDELVRHVESGAVTLSDVITHRMRLDEAPHGYDIFNKKRDACLKVLLRP